MSYSFPEQQLQQTLSHMRATIAECGLKLLESSNMNDFLVRDAAYLRQLAVPDISFAWMVGDVHSQLVVLGLHKQEHEQLPALANQGTKGNRFFELAFGCDYDPGSLTEITRDQFLGLAEAHPVPYRWENMAGDLFQKGFEKFRLSRASGFIVGEVSIKCIGASRDGTLELRADIAIGKGAQPRAWKALELWTHAAIGDALREAGRPCPYTFGLIWHTIHHWEAVA